MNIKILDNLSNTISTIEYSDERWPNKFKNPSITYNIFQNEEVSNEPRIKVIDKDMAQIVRMGYVIVSIPVKIFGQKWDRYQQNVLALVSKNSIEASRYKVYKTIPRQKGNYHRIEFDEANKRIRLKGRWAGPSGEGPWIQL